MYARKRSDHKKMLEKKFEAFEGLNNYRNSLYWHMGNKYLDGGQHITGCFPKKCVEVSGEQAGSIRVLVFHFKGI